MKKIILMGLMVGLITTQYSCAYADKKGSALNYDKWANVLSQYVDSNGRVDYQGLKANPHDLNQFTAHIERLNVDELNSDEKLAFWINAYNAITLKVVTDSYPVKSIRRINFGLVWNVGRKVAQKKHSLGHIEHKILRPLGDPRIHFAINCASIGCPKLLNQIFDPAMIDEQLDIEAKRFINDPDKVKLDRSQNILYYSAIFDWFEKDFLVVEKDILSYIKRYINPADRKYLDENSVKLKVLDYDWGLNQQ